MEETFDKTLKRLLLQGKPLRIAIALASRENPRGYEVYLKSIFDFKFWKEDESEKS